MTEEIGRNFLVYRIQHIETDEMIYIGSTSMPLDRRFFAHKYRSSQPVKYYMIERGINNWKIEQIGECDNYADMVELERNLIIKERPICNKCVPTKKYIRNLRKIIENANMTAKMT